MTLYLSPIILSLLLQSDCMLFLAQNVLSIAVCYHCQSHYHERRKHFNQNTQKKQQLISDATEQQQVADRAAHIRLFGVVKYKDLNTPVSRDLFC